MFVTAAPDAFDKRGVGGSFFADEIHTTRACTNIDEENHAAYTLLSSAAANDRDAYFSLERLQALQQPGKRVEFGIPALQAREPAEMQDRQAQIRDEEQVMFLVP